MKKTICRFLIFSLMFVSCFFITGCGSETDASQSYDAETLVYGSGDYTAINPALFEHGEINALLFAGLTARDADNSLVAGLASDWEYDKAEKTWIFHLRDNLIFHDGHELTSEDVKFTLEAILDPKNQSEIRSNYAEIEEIQCPDKLTVKVRLNEENVAFDEYMTIGILPRHLLEGEDLTTSQFNQNPVGAGPYRMTAWDMGQSITMEKFEAYYGGEPNIDRIIFKIVSDSDARAMQLKNGDLDMAQITAKTAETMAKSEGLKVYHMNTADYRAIAYNFAHPYFQAHPELPNILSYAIDRQAVVDSVLMGEGEAAYSPLQKGDFYNSDMEAFSYNPEKCCQLLEAAGWVRGQNGYYEKDGETLAFTIAAQADDKVRVDMALMCASQLQQIGADVAAETRQSLDWGGQQACIIGWGSPFDPDDHTYKVFTTGAGDNYTSYSNASVDEILEAARRTDDQSERCQLYKDFQTALMEQLPYTFVAYVDADYAIKEGIHGISQETILGHHGVGIFWNIAEWSIGE